MNSNTMIGHMHIIMIPMNTVLIHRMCITVTQRMT